MVARKPCHTVAAVLITLCVAAAHAQQPETTTPAKPPLIEVQAHIKFDAAPRWAVLQRELIQLMNEAAPMVIEKYTHPDGRMLWPGDNVTEIGLGPAVDDMYESFHNWPILYLVGGSDEILELSRRQFDAITKQLSQLRWAGYGDPVLVNEYNSGYDAFHQAEGNLFFYMLCMADPANEKNIERARRFADFYVDPEHGNYDPETRIIRCAHTGSLGPRHDHFKGDTVWTTSDYGLPFWDVPGFSSLEDIGEPEKMREFARIVNERKGRGDITMNLAFTSLATNAYLLTGDEKYRRWVLEYVDAWMERTRENGGIVPDNVGLSGEVGEYMDGNWYGGHYGWIWPHGWGSLGAAVAMASQNATLVSRDPAYMNFLRSQLDILADNAIERDGVLYVPHKYVGENPAVVTPGGWLSYVLRNPDTSVLQQGPWYEFCVFQPKYPAHLWQMTRLKEDMERFLRLHNPRQHPVGRTSWHHMKDLGGRDAWWVMFMRGELDDYPERILAANLADVRGNLAYIERDTVSRPAPDAAEPEHAQDPRRIGSKYMHHRRNPMALEALVTTTMGAPLPIYYGGLMVTPIRHFDWNRKRPGLPEDVAALVSELAPYNATIEFYNLGDETRTVLVQAGSMKQHRFRTWKYGSPRDGVPWDHEPEEINGEYLLITLPAKTTFAVLLHMEMYVNQPTLALPW